MIGENTLKLNRETIMELLEFALKEKILKETDFKVSDITGTYGDYTITLSEKEADTPTESLRKTDYGGSQRVHYDKTTAENKNLS